MYSMNDENIPNNQPKKELDSVSSLVQSPSKKKDVIRVISNGRSSASGKEKKIVAILSIVSVILISALIYAFAFSGGSIINPLPDKNGSSGPDSGGIVSKGETFENPINGMIFSKEEAKKFQNNKPIAVMVNNYVVARPSSGLSKADIIYEAVAEGGITRLMPIFYSRIPSVVSSVRSARYYFVQLASSYSPIYAHWGAAHVPDCQKAPVTSSSYCPPIHGQVETEPAVDAYDMIVKLGVPNLDGGNYSCDSENCAFGRDPNKVGKIPLEHTAFTRLPLIYELAKKIRPQDSWNTFTPFTPWKFKDEASLKDRGTVGKETPITFNYWDTMAGFNVKWVYDSDKNEYIRYQGDVKQTDGLSGEELRAKVVIIRFTKQELVGDKKSHLYHDIAGSGKALIFQDGNVINANWARSNPDTMDVYTDLSSKEFEFVRGQIWVQLVPTDNIITYEKAAPVMSQ